MGRTWEVPRQPISPAPLVMVDGPDVDVLALDTISGVLINDDHGVTYTLRVQVVTAAGARVTVWRVRGPGGLTTVDSEDERERRKTAWREQRSEAERLQRLIVDTIEGLDQNPS